jgi:tRNA(Ile)-lysidine synthase
MGRAETIAYCAALDLQPREDETNRSHGPARNRLRHEVLPILDELYPAASANIARAARLLAADYDLIERLAHHALDTAVTSWEGARVSLSLDHWKASEPALRPHMLRLLLEHLYGSTSGFEEQHIAALLGALDAPTSRVQLTLPHGLAMVRRGGEAVLGAPAAPLPPLATYRLPVPGTVTTEVGIVSAKVVTAPADWSRVPAHVAYLAPAATGPALEVRAWRSGDRLQPLGLAGTRKLQDVLTDAKIPREQRQRVPVVEGRRGIAWVGGLCTAEPYRVAAGESAVRVTWQPAHSASLGHRDGPLRDGVMEWERDAQAMEQ